MQRAELVQAFVLHRRPWEDNGSIIELFTATHGRLSAFARGVRGTKAKLAGVLQPFVPLLVSWAGRGEAPRLIHAEIDHATLPASPLPPARMMSAWYCSELVLALTARHDPQPELFACYRGVLEGLRTDARQEKVLRLYEKRLLEILGYGIAGLEEARFDDPEELERLRPVLKARMTQCLEGRDLRTRDVAISLKQFERSWQGH
ncbi:MAG: DNA repair protein RecO [Pseudomonadota bacterium]|nr:MAG: DNA repair protein RecO [Pseudomonadota bacterium]